MEVGAVYTFTGSEQFWSELDDLLSLSPTSSLAELDYALRNYIAFASHFMDEYLAAPGALDHTLFALLESSLFVSHVDRMTANIISCLSTSTSPSALFISLMLILHLGMANPLSPSSALIHEEFQSGGSSKVFKAMRKKWNDVVPVLIDCVEKAGVVENARIDHTEGKTAMPEDGWEERLGTAATAILYEVCRVQRLSLPELSLFSYEFITHLFTLVEKTRDAEDETFNYTLIKLLIALNEQFMVSSLPPPATDGSGSLPPPILPNILHSEKKKEKGTNLVLEVLKSREADSKTFGENIIFILNRSNGSPDSLCVSLLILKILYLLFTTSGTQEYFYTNDLCVLVDVFIRELCDLGEESEGLKHTYLRVLHPLLTNTQLRHHPYKRPLLRRVLFSLISNSSYRECDPTTRRLVERNLRGSWCEGLTDTSIGEGEKRAIDRRKGSTSSAAEPMGLGWSSGMGRSASEGVLPKSTHLSIVTKEKDKTKAREWNASTTSVDAIAQADDVGIASDDTRRARKAHIGEEVLAQLVYDVENGSSPNYRSRSSTTLSCTPSPLSTSVVIVPIEENLCHAVLTQSPSSTIGNPLPIHPYSRSAHESPVVVNLAELPVVDDGSLRPASPPPRPSSAASMDQPLRRRRAPPPPSADANAGITSRPRTPQIHYTDSNNSSPKILSNASLCPIDPPRVSGRRAAPEPPKGSRSRVLSNASASGPSPYLSKASPSDHSEQELGNVEPDLRSTTYRLGQLSVGSI